MYSKCSICTVATGKESLVVMDKERRRIWEIMISPLVNILDLKDIALVTCSDCFELLNAMVSFQQTMVAGVNRLFNIQNQKQGQGKRKHKPTIINKNIFALPPPVMFSEKAADLALPVAWEEMVYSSETWHENEYVVPETFDVLPTVKNRGLGFSGTVFHNIDPNAPATVRLSEVMHGRVNRGRNDDLAVLVPVKEKPINLLCEEKISYSSEPNIKEPNKSPKYAKKGAKSRPTNVSEVKKQKLNRRLYEQLRATIKSPTLLEKFDSTYEPASVSELAHSKTIEFSHKPKEWDTYKPEPKLNESCHNLIDPEHKLRHNPESTNVFVHEMKLDSGRIPRDTLPPYVSIWRDDVQGPQFELGHLSWRVCERDNSQGHKLMESRHDSNVSVRKSDSQNSPHDPGHELTHNSEPISRDDTADTWRDKLINEIKNNLGPISNELKDKSSHVSGDVLKNKSGNNSNESMQKLSESHKSIHDFGQELTHNSDSTSRDVSADVWKDKLINEIKHNFGPILNELENKSIHVSGHKLNNESGNNSNESVHKLNEAHKSTHDFEQKKGHDSRMSSKEQGQIWRDKLIHEIKNELGNTSEHESSHVSNHDLCKNSNGLVHKLCQKTQKSANDLEHELTRNSGAKSTNESADGWKDKLIKEISQELGILRNEWEESKHKLQDDSRHKFSELTHKPVYEPSHIQKHGSRNVTGHELKDESGYESTHVPEHGLLNGSGHKSRYVSGHVLQNGLEHKSRDVPQHESTHLPEHKLQNGSGHKSRDVSQHDLRDVPQHESTQVPRHESTDAPRHGLQNISGHDVSHDSGHDWRDWSDDSASTLSCNSDYEDPELYPNIIFAQSFKEVSEDVNLHSHIVTNPPSEWPCTGEKCHLQDSSSEEDETEEPAPKSDDDQNGLVSEHSSEMEPLQPSPTWLACAACGMRFRRAHGLRGHEASARHAARALWRYQCDICQRKCPDKKKMTEHMEREHSAEDRMKCPMCPALFKSARALGRHASAHIMAPADTHTQTHTETRKTRNVNGIRTRNPRYIDDVRTRNMDEIRTRKKRNMDDIRTPKTRNIDDIRTRKTRNIDVVKTRQKRNVHNIKTRQEINMDDIRTHQEINMDIRNEKHTNGLKRINRRTIKRNPKTKVNNMYIDSKKTNRASKSEPKSTEQPVGKTTRKRYKANSRKPKKGHSTHKNTKRLPRNGITMRYQLSRNPNSGEHSMHTNVRDFNIDAYSYGYDITNSYQISKRNPENEHNVHNVDYNIDNYANGHLSKSIKTNKRPNGEHMHNVGTYNTEAYLHEHGITKRYQVAKRTYGEHDMNMEAHTFNNRHEGQNTANNKRRRNEDHMYMSVFNEQSNVNNQDTNISTMLQANGHDYTTNTQESNGQNSKETNRQTNGRVYKKKRYACTQKRRTRGRKTSLEILPVISNVVSLFNTLTL